VSDQGSQSGEHGRKGLRPQALFRSWSDYCDRMQRVRLVDVAREAGVHPATASRALSPDAHGEVSPGTVLRVRRAAERLGYVPNTLARGLRTSRSYVAALVVPDITNALFPPIVRGAEQVLTDAGFTLVLTDTNNAAEVERSQIASLRAHGVDGFIIATASWEDPLLADLAAEGFPTVLVNRRCATSELPFVGGDDQQGVRLCVEHLADLGHRDIVHLAGPAGTSTGRERAHAFRAAMRDRNLPVRNAVLECAGYTEQAGASGAARLLARRRPFTAIVAANDLLALGVMDELARAGLRCPRDYSITGFNDLAFMDKLTPPLTTVRVPFTEMGARAARDLLDWISHAQPTTTQSMLPVALVVRGTTGPVASQHVS
jgi:LacI family transcriptional regulator